jgi:hypothetical protein
LLGLWRARLCAFGGPRLAPAAVPAISTAGRRNYFRGAGSIYQILIFPQGEHMKKLFTVVLTLVLGGALTFAQAGGGSTDSTQTPPQQSHKGGKKATKTKKSHKGGKKSKKGSSTTTTPPPK